VGQKNILWVKLSGPAKAFRNLGYNMKRLAKFYLFIRTYKIDKIIIKRFVSMPAYL
jgi:hypothetical protein